MRGKNADNAPEELQNQTSALPLSAGSGWRGGLNYLLMQCRRENECTKKPRQPPPPSPIGGITAVCGSRSHDNLSARPPPPTLFSWGGGILVFFMKNYFASWWFSLLRGEGEGQESIQLNGQPTHSACSTYFSHNKFGVHLKIEDIPSAVLTVLFLILIVATIYNMCYNYACV